MPRAVNNVAHKKRKKKYLKAAKGYVGGRSKLYRTARQAVEKAWQYAYRDRRVRKRDFRRLWITRINAAAREHGISYSRFIDGLHKTGIEVDRKVLAYLAFSEPEVFGHLCAIVKGEASVDDAFQLTTPEPVHSKRSRKVQPKDEPEKTASIQDETTQENAETDETPGEKEEITE